MKKLKMIYEPKLGIVQKPFYDHKVKELNLELVKVKLSKDDDEGHYQIFFQDWTKKKTTTFFKLHLSEAMELKGIIDELIYLAVRDEIDDIRTAIKQHRKI